MRSHQVGCRLLLPEHAKGLAKPDSKVLPRSARQGAKGGKNGPQPISQQPKKRSMTALSKPTIGKSCWAGDWICITRQTAVAHLPSRLGAPRSAETFLCQNRAASRTEQGNLGCHKRPRRQQATLVSNAWCGRSRARPAIRCRMPVAGEEMPAHGNGSRPGRGGIEYNQGNSPKGR